MKWEPIELVWNRENQSEGTSVMPRALLGKKAKQVTDVPGIGLCGHKNGEVRVMRKWFWK